MPGRAHDYGTIGGMRGDPVAVDAVDQPLLVTPDEVLSAARALLELPGRALLGLVGAPGAGKSHLAAWLCGRLGEGAVVLPMDGFHLAGVELERLGRAGRKGAPDTFDAAGFVALVRRCRVSGAGSAGGGETVYAPEFRRSIEEPIAGAIPIFPLARLVIVEGNYLLLNSLPWNQLHDLLDQIWFVDPPEELRLSRLVERHVAFGKGAAAAREWALGPDQANAELITSGRSRADVAVRLLVD